MTIYDPIIIDYDDDYDFEAKEDPSDEKKHQNYIYYSKRWGSPLSEIEVDPGYELERVHPNDLEWLNKMRDRFGQRGYEPISYSDLSAFLYKTSEDEGKPMSKFHIIHLLRRLWRYGELTRYIRGKVKGAVKTGRGEWYGVHYKLYPTKKEESQGA